jgi:hypothetical protein
MDAKQGAVMEAAWNFP